MTHIITQSRGAREQTIRNIADEDRANARRARLLAAVHAQMTGPGATQAERGRQGALNEIVYAVERRCAPCGEPPFGRSEEYVDAYRSTLAGIERIDGRSVDEVCRATM